jgi:hypothetical protein
MDDPIVTEPLDEGAAFMKEMKASKHDLKKCIAIADALLDEEEDGTPDAQAGALTTQSSELIVRSAKSVEDSHQLIDAAREIAKRHREDGPP